MIAGLPEAGFGFGTRDAPMGELLAHTSSSTQPGKLRPLPAVKVSVRTEAHHEKLTSF